MDVKWQKISMIKRRSLSLTGIICLLVFFVAIGKAVAGGEYAVIVNVANNYNADTNKMKEYVKQIYLKRRNAWPDKSVAKVYGRPKGTPEQDSFINNVLGMTQARLTEHWLSLKQRTGESGPRKIGSDGILIKFVKKYPGTIAVLKAEKAVSASNEVKVLFTFP
ncbi:MAG: hypothetical protein ACUZ8E_15510 [Candidatus Anammoxibacter sp.]